MRYLCFFQFADHPPVCVMCYSNKKKTYPERADFTRSGVSLMRIFFDAVRFFAIFFSRKICKYAKKVVSLQSKQGCCTKTTKKYVG